MSSKREEPATDRRAAMPTGSSRLGLRRYNERLVMDLIRRAGPLAKADIARRTGLTPQTATVIVNHLIAQGYLLKQQARRGRVGQPSTPIALNPAGVYSIGIIVGRRAQEAITTDFTARVINRTRVAHPWPDRARVFDEIRNSVRYLVQALGPHEQTRLAGIGIAGPGDLHGWEAVIGAPKGALADWRGVDIRARVAAETGLDTWMLNDASAACLAEMTLGIARHHRSVLYFYVATFIGGGLILDGQLHSGSRDNAAALGSMPLCRPTGRAPPQLIEAASLYALRAALGGDRALFQAAMDGTLADDAPEMAVVARWVEEAARAIAFAIMAGISVVDVEAVIIDGVMHRGLIAQLVDRLRSELGRYNHDGLLIPDLHIGQVGRDARLRGAAMLPLHALFAPDNTLFLKAAAGARERQAANID